MKKFFTLAFALVFSTGIAFAQNNSTTVTQSGDDSDAVISQNGSSHEAIVNQNSGFGTGHIAEISQSNGSDNLSEVEQNQANAEAYVTQVGSDNESYTKQAGFNEMFVDQEGDGNVLTGYDGGSVAYQKNGTGVFASDKNVLDLDQVGDFNTAGVWQEHHGDATIQQYGSDNDGQIYQSGSPNQALNQASITQGVSAYTSNFNAADIRQNGEGNTASFGLQMGDHNDVDIDQIGNQNYSELSIKYGDLNEVTMDVDGVGNRTRFSIDASWGAKSSSNVVNFSKTGDGNYLSGKIEGDGNMVDVSQTGNSNRVGTDWYTKDGVAIMGNSNTVSVTQMSNSNFSTVTVNGSNNTATVTQN